MYVGRSNVLLGAAIAAGFFWFGFYGHQPSHAMSRAEYRAHVRAMPLLERPNRPGHFYGNTVRRMHHWRHGR